MGLKRALYDWQRKNYFRELVYQGDMDKDEIRARKALRTVVLVRDDILPPIHQGIQAAHAVLKLVGQPHLDTFSQLRQEMAGAYLILLGADFTTMADKIDLARKKKLEWAMYEDTGLVDPETGIPVITAVAFEPLTAGEVKRYFGNLKRSQ